jgi:xanthine dehydrogenase YagS FAD-binding subunit
MLRLEGARIADARLVLGGVAPIPWRAGTAERALVGGEPSEQLFAHVAEAALADARPLAHNGYKLPLAKALVRRALETLVEGTGGAA